MQTSIVSHGEVDRSAKETYGAGPLLLRVGNGGAGATGLIKCLAEDYLSTLKDSGSIEWVCNHSRNTQLALLYGVIDIALTYERDQEVLAEQEGWSRSVGCIFHDHFVLVGPISDPAGVQSSRTLEHACTAIANSRSLFHSRADFSATMWKERSLWAKAGLAPWQDETAHGWYQTSLLSPADALIGASAAGAYLLTDRSTLLRQTALKTIHNLTVFAEPDDDHHILMNDCSALVRVGESSGHDAGRDRFLAYLTSGRGQDLISRFGKNDLGGFPLFASLKEGFASSSLKKGCPKDGQWSVIELGAQE